MLNNFGDQWLFLRGRDAIHVFSCRTDRWVRNALMDEETCDSFEPREPYPTPGSGFSHNEENLMSAVCELLRASLDRCPHFIANAQSHLVLTRS